MSTGRKRPPISRGLKQLRKGFYEVLETGRERPILAGAYKRTKNSMSKQASAT